MNIFFGLVSIILSIYIAVSYIPEIVRGKIKPHAFSWLPWTIITGIGFAVQFKNGEDVWGYGTLGVTAIICLIIFLLSLKYGEKHITRSDTFALISSLLLIVFWIVIQDDFWAVILICLIDGIGFFPTWRKSYHKPYEESIDMYFISSVKSFLSLFSLKNFIFVNWLYPVFLIFINLAFTLYIVWRRKAITK